MKAIIIDNPEIIDVEEVPRPDIPPDGVLVKVAYCGICGTDMDIFAGRPDFARLVRYPVRIGHEWSGIVEETGSSVKRFKKGDRVTGDGKITCGVCAACLVGDYGHCGHIIPVGTVGDSAPGSMAEFIAMPEWNLYHLPDTLDLKEAAAIEPASIALNALMAANAGPGKCVLVIGTGPIGLAAAGLAKALGAKRVMLAGRTPYKLTKGLVMGADTLLNVSQKNLLQAVEASGVIKPDIVVETSGSTESVSQALAVVNKMGTIALLGLYDKDLNAVDLNQFVLNKIACLGIGGSGNAFGEVIKLLSSGSLSLKPLITHEYGLDGIHEAMELLRSKNPKRIKVMLHIADGQAT